MNRIGIVFIGASVALLGSVIAFANGGEPPGAASNSLSPKIRATAAAPTPILVELFTSEGCSSCPPADALLARLAKRAGLDGAQIIPLEEHVDYWDHLGWSDPFSDRRYSQRQASYAQLLHLEQVYTPQMVVDGHKELLGSDENSARSAISSSLQTSKVLASVTVGGLQGTGVTLNIRIAPIPATQSDDVTDVIVAITEDNLQSNVVRGENAGRRLRHVGVVRSWRTIGRGSKTESFAWSQKVTLDSSWKRPDLHAVVFAQGHDSGHVYAAATTKIDVIKHD